MTWVGKEQVIQLLSGIVAIEGYLQFERAVNLLTIYFPFRLLSFINSGCHEKKVKRGQNVYLSYNFANSIGGANCLFLSRKFDPPRLFKI